MARRGLGITLAASAVLATACTGLIGVVDVSTMGAPGADGGKSDVGSPRSDAGGHDSGADATTGDDAGEDATTADDAEGDDSAGDDADQDDAGGDGGDDSGGVDAPPFDYAAGDIGAACVPPDGGPTCTPGRIQCSDGGLADAGTCGAPAYQCCEVNGSPSVCQLAGQDASTCSGDVLRCAEAADCSGNKICCLAATSEMNAIVSCQDAPVCPTAGAASAQICRSNAECRSGACVIYSCLGLSIEACKGTLDGLITSDCTPTP